MANNLSPAERIELNADLAEIDPERDELGFAPLAKSIAEGIQRQSPIEGLVIGITGKWGYGKTTMINFIRHYLKGTAIEIVLFSPWWFSDHEDLVRRLLQEINSHVSPGEVNKERLNKAIQDLTELISPLSIDFKPGGIGASLDFTKLSTKSKPDVPGLKTKIGALLKELSIKFLIVVDDVDRLSTPEIRDLFRAIKAVGDLPNITYLVALDTSVVAAALNECYSNRGDAYLDKILQVSFALPPPSEHGIARIFGAGFNRMLESLEEPSREERDRLSLLYGKGLRHMIKSPRDAVRLLNALYVTVPTVGKEVNLGDFISMESLRLFLPTVYEAIRTNKDQFAGLTYQSPSAQEKLCRFHEQWMKDINDSSTDWLRDLLIELFPNLDYAWNNMHYGNHNLRDWRKELRVCSPEIFEAYFRFAQPTETISASDLDSFLGCLNDDRPLSILHSKATSESVEDKNWLWNLLQRLFDHVDELNSNAAERLFGAIFDTFYHYRHLDGVRNQAYLLEDNSHLLNGIQRRLLYRIDEKRLPEVLRTALKKPFPVDPMVTVVVEIGRGLGKFRHLESTSQRKTLLTEEEFNGITQLYLSRIQDILDKEECKTTTEITRILWTVEALDVDRMNLLVGRLRRSMKGVIGLISYGLTTSRDPFTGRSTYEIDLESISNIVEPDTLVEGAEEVIKRGSLDQRSIAIADAFLEMMKSANRDSSENS